MNATWPHESPYEETAAGLQAAITQRACEDSLEALAEAQLAALKATRVAINSRIKYERDAREKLERVIKQAVDDLDALSARFGGPSRTATQVNDIRYRLSAVLEESRRP